MFIMFFFFQNEIGVTGFATLDVKQVIKHVILRRCSVTKVPSAVGLAEERWLCPLNWGHHVYCLCEITSVIWSSKVSAVQGVLMSMGKWLGLSELSIILWVSAVEGCRVQLYFLSPSFSSLISPILPFLSLPSPALPSPHPSSLTWLPFLLCFTLPLVMMEWMKVHTNGNVQHGANADIDGDYFFFKGGQSVGIIKILQPMSPLRNYYECLIVNRGERATIGIGVCMPLLGVHHCTTYFRVLHIRPMWALS